MHYTSPGSHFVEDFQPRQPQLQKGALTNPTAIGAISALVIPGSGITSQVTNLNTKVLHALLLNHLTCEPCTESAKQRLSYRTGVNRG